MDLNITVCSHTPYVVVKDQCVCEFCEHRFCDACKNDRCEWCEHMRGDQILCPHCASTIFICDQTICSDCIRFALEDNELVFCETCDDFKFIHNEDAEECQKQHKTTQDELQLKEKLEEMYPDIKLRM